MGNVNTGIIVALEREVRKYIILPKNSTVKIREVKVCGGRIEADVSFVIDPDNAVKEVSVVVDHADQTTRRPLFVPLVKKGNALKPKRKYTRRVVNPTTDDATLKSLDTKDRLDPSRVFTTSEDDLKLIRTYIYNWRRYEGALTEDQLRAMKPTEGIHVNKMSDVQKAQLLNIFNDVRKKRGLIK